MRIRIAAVLLTLASTASYAQIEVVDVVELDPSRPFDVSAITVPEHDYMAFIALLQPAVGVELAEFWGPADGLGPWTKVIISAASSGSLFFDLSGHVVYDGSSLHFTATRTDPDDPGCSDLWLYSKLLPNGEWEDTPIAEGSCGYIGTDVGLGGLPSGESLVSRVDNDNGLGDLILWAYAVNLLLENLDGYRVDLGKDPGKSDVPDFVLEGVDPRQDPPAVELVPDGTMTFYEATDSSLRWDFQGGGQQRSGVVERRAPSTDLTTG